MNLHPLNNISNVKKIDINKYILVSRENIFDQQLFFNINRNINQVNHLSFDDLSRFKSTKSFIFYSNESAINYIKTRDISTLGDFFVIDDIKVTSYLGSLYNDIYINVYIPHMSYDYNDFEVNNKRKVIPTIVSLAGRLYLIFIIEDVLINR